MVLLQATHPTMVVIVERQWLPHTLQGPSHYTWRNTEAVLLHQEKALYSVLARQRLLFRANVQQEKGLTLVHSN